MGKSMPSNVAERIAQLLREKDKDYLPAGQIRKGLRKREWELLGLKKEAPVPKMLKKLDSLLGGNFHVYHKGKSGYVGFRQPPGVIIFNAVTAKPGKTAGQLAQVLPMVKKEFIENLNRLLADGDVICRLNQRYAPCLDPPARGRVTAPAPKATVQKEEPGRVPQDLASDRAAFKAAYDAIGKGEGFVRIHRVRERLAWSRERFDALFERLVSRGAIQLHQGDPSQMTEDQVRDSWQDDQGFLFITFSWRES